MRIGLAYMDDQAAPYRPLNADLLREARPDFVALTVHSLPELRDRIGEVDRLRIRATYVIPVETVSPIVARLMVRAILDCGARQTERIVIGAAPASRMSPGQYLTAAVRILFEAGTYNRLALGVGGLQAGRAGVDWLAEVVRVVASGELARQHLRAFSLAHYPPAAISRRHLARLAAVVRDALPAAELHLSTGWRLGRRLERLERLLAAWRTRRLDLVAGSLTLPVHVGSELRDAWLVDAWRAWRSLDGSSLTVFGHVENASPAGAWSGWNVVDGPAAGSAWRRLRLASALGAAMVWQSPTDGNRAAQTSA